MIRNQTINQGLEYNMKTFLKDMDKIMAKAKIDIEENNVYDAREFFDELEEKVHYRV